MQYTSETLHIKGFSSAYQVELSNDSAFVGANVDGTISKVTLEETSETEIFVYYEGEDVSDKFVYYWEITGYSPNFPDAISYYEDIKWDPVKKEWGKGSEEWIESDFRSTGPFWGKKIKYSELGSEKSIATVRIFSKSDQIAPENAINAQPKFIKNFTIVKIISPTTYRLTMQPTFIKKGVPTEITYKVYATANGETIELDASQLGEKFKVYDINNSKTLFQSGGKISDTTTFALEIPHYHVGGTSWVNWGYQTIGSSLDGTSPYVIDLDGSSAVVGADDFGKVDKEALRWATETNVKVYHGASDITDQCTFTWEATYENSAYWATADSLGPKGWLTEMEGTKAGLKVKVKLEDTEIGIKSVSIKKVLGSATYKLVVNPTMIQKDLDTDINIKVAKFCDGDKGYIDIGEGKDAHIFKGDSKTELGSANAQNGLKDTINASTTYHLRIGPDLFENSVEWDTQTVGENGSTPYRLALSEDFISVPSDADGTVDEGFEYDTIKPSILYGKTVDENWVPWNEAESMPDGELVLKIENDGSGFEAGFFGKEIKIKKGFNNEDLKDIDRATFSVILYVNHEEYTSVTYEAVKNKSGKDGEYVYLLASPQGYNTSAVPSEITLQMMKRSSAEGTNKYDQDTWYKYSIDGGTLSSTYLLQKGNGEITPDLYKTATGNIIFEVYSDEECTKLLDRETITVVSNGANSTVPGPSNEVVYLYKLYTPTTKSKPIINADAASTWTHSANTNVTKESPYLWVVSGSKWTSSDGSTTGHNNSWSEPKLYKVYCGEFDPIRAAEYYNTFATLDDGGNFVFKEGVQMSSTGQWYINASYINAGMFTVKKPAEGDEEEATIFAAGWNEDGEGKVEMASWLVTQEALRTINNNGVPIEPGEAGCMILSPSGVQINSESNNIWKKNEWSIAIGKTFGVTSAGELYATGGQIAGWGISSNGLSIGDLGVNGIQLYPNGEKATNKFIIDDIEKTWVLGIGKHFGVTEEGVLYATNAAISGRISANDGNVAGWEIGQNSLTKTLVIDEEHQQNFGLFSHINATDQANGQIVLASGYTNSVQDANFKIDYTGSCTCNNLFSTNAAISGSLSSKQLLVQNHKILEEVSTDSGANQLIIRTSSGSTDIRIRESKTKDVSFVVSLTEKVGIIGEGVYFNARLEFDDASVLKDENGNWKVFTVECWWATENGSSRSGKLVFNLQMEYSYTDQLYVSYADLGCGTFTEDYGALGPNQLNAVTKAQAYRKNKTSAQLWENFANKADALTVEISNSVGVVVIHGDLIPTSNGKFNIGTTGNENTGERNKKWNNIYLTGVCYEDDKSSDIRVKNSISTLPIEYEIFFDKMEPTRYKYNEGTSNRYHTGFIAQQLVTALEESNLTAQDFAGVMLLAPGTENECWYLRRDEFVALNTWQIQKLKPRVSALEQAILDYESRISALETEIQNLKS